CQQHITPAFPHFQFTHADVFHPAYNPRGRIPGRDCIFPCKDASFDFVFLTSVFTHLLPAEVARYLGQVQRVLRPGGRLLATFFLLNRETRAFMLQERSLYCFDRPGPGFWAASTHCPEAAVAYEEVDIRRMLGDSGLRVCEPVYHGSWAGSQ